VVVMMAVVAMDAITIETAPKVVVKMDTMD
jgi:hypothetical protein